MPQREVEICKRVLQIRVDSKLSRVAFAEEIKEDSLFLANIEYGRAPVRYWLARKIAERFDVNQRWIATGQQPKKYYVDISPEIESTILPRDLFSEAFDKVIGSLVEDRLVAISEIIKAPIETLDEGKIEPGLWPAAGSSSGESLSFFLTRIIQFDLHWLPEEFKKSYFDTVSKAAADFIAKHGIEADRLKKRAEHDQKKKPLARPSKKSH